MLATKKVIGMKTEASQGSIATLAESDFFNAFDVESDVEVEFIDPNYVSSSLDPFAQLIGKRWMTAKFKRFLFASGSKGVAVAPLSALLQACGLTETIVTSTSVTYAPSSNPATNYFGPGKSATIKLHEDGSASLSGLYKILTGAMGNCKLIIQAGKPVTIESEFKGLYTAVADAVVPTNTPSSVAAPIVLSALFSVGSYAAIIEKLEIDLANEVSEKPSVNAATGILGFQITGRKPQGSIDPEAVLVATHDFYGRMVAGTLGAITITIGTGAGSITTITMPQVQYGKVTTGKRSGELMIFNVPLIPLRSSGDDWISIAQT
jgi:hypothetical protein